MANIEDQIKSLPPELREEVEDFVAFLTQRHSSGVPSSAPTLDWAGALRDMSGQFSSVALQHAMAEWRMPAQ